MRSFRFIVFSIAATASVVASEHPAELAGRWRSENMPVGYWVIDRYSDGRLAKKEYERKYSDQPAEITATWGRWRLRGNTYEEFYQGSTYKNARAIVGTWWKMRVQKITPQRFFHLSGDGHGTFEDRFLNRRPLLDVKQPPPKQYRWPKLVDTIKPARGGIPAWVNSVPAVAGPRTR